MSAAASLKSFEDLYAEIQALPEGSHGEILTPGQLHITMGRPGKAHRRASKLIGDDLRGADHQVGGTGWWIENEPEVRFGVRLFDPDLAGWRLERVSELPENPIDVLPDWVCEVLSPASTARTDLKVKLPTYAQHDVAFIWLVNPDVRVVQVFKSENGQPVLVATASDEDDIRLPPFDLDMHPSRWWLPIDPEAPTQR